MGAEEIFLSKTPVTYSLRSTIDKWNLIKLQNFCKAKDTVNRTKTATKRLGKDLYQSNIYKELKKLNSR
jgi:phage-related baseplate assembly protein